MIKGVDRDAVPLNMAVDNISKCIDEITENTRRTQSKEKLLQEKLRKKKTCMKH